jgi:gamma-glutamyltranspeptidase
LVGWLIGRSIDLSLIQLFGVVEFELKIFLFWFSFSGLNVWFGSQLLTNGGFLLNNALANFGQGKNSPSPGKRPMSLATPIIATEKRRVCGRRLLIGAADATVAAQVLSRLLVLDKNITDSIEAPRFQIAEGNSTVFLEGECGNMVR